MPVVDTGGKGLIQFDNLATGFGPGQTAEVRNRYQWTVSFGPTANLTGGAVGNATGTGGPPTVGYYVKSTDLPRTTIENQVLNQYNIRRNISTHVSYEPITMTFYDTQDNSFLNFLKNTLNFRWMNWQNAANVRAPFGLGAGYVPEFGLTSPQTGFGQGGLINGVGLGDQSLTSTMNDNYLSYVTITKMMMAAGKPGTPAQTVTTPNVTAMGDYTGYTDTTQVPATPDGPPTDASQQITIYNPKIVDISQDRLDYADGNSVLTWTITLRYESWDWNGPQTPGWTATTGVIGDAARQVQETGRTIGRFFTDLARRIF